MSNSAFACPEGIQNINPDVLLPHNGEMVMVDRLVSVGDQELTSSIIPKREHAPVGPPETVNAWVGLEYIAQSAGCLGGIHRHPPKKGYLVAARSVKAIVPHFHVNVELLCKVILVGESEQSSSFDGVISDASGNKLLSARISIFHLEYVSKSQ